MITLAERVAELRDRIDSAAIRSGRTSGSARIVAATKTVAVEQLREVVAAGVTDLGENRARDLLAKAEVIAAPVHWHFIGQLQRNKVRALSPRIELWQSVDRVSLARAIADHAPGARVLLQVNLGSEAQKGGCTRAEAAPLADAARALGLRVDGLMTVPPHDDEPRHWFAALRGLRDDLGLTELSMGMSEDFEIAVEEGATMVRLGRALFGARPAAPPPAGTASVT